MLSLSRKPGQSVEVTTDTGLKATVTLLSQKGNVAQIKVEAAGQNAKLQHEDKRYYNIAVLTVKLNQSIEIFFADGELVECRYYSPYGRQPRLGFSSKVRFATFLRSEIVPKVPQSN